MATLSDVRKLSQALWERRYLAALDSKKRQTLAEMLQAEFYRRDRLRYKRTFDESQVSRGQPENAGEFAMNPGSKSVEEKEAAVHTRGQQAIARMDAFAAKSKAKQDAKNPVIKLAPSKARAFNGAPVTLRTKISKQESGRMGESIVLAWLRGLGFSDAGPMNTRISNFPIDIFHDHATVEIKTGLVSNGRGAQQWRLTIGEPGNAEKDKIAKMSDARKATYNERKQTAIKERKEKILNELAKEKGKPIKPKTITVLLNPDTKTADIYEFDGWHDRIGWNSDQAKAGYKGSVTYA